MRRIAIDNEAFPATSGQRNNPGEKMLINHEQAMNRLKELREYWANEKKWPKELRLVEDVLRERTEVFEEQIDLAFEVIEELIKCLPRWNELLQQ